MTTLSQFVALHFVYRRLLVACGILPLLLLIAPVFLAVYISTWNLLSGGFAGLTHILSLGITVTAYHIIHSLSKSEESFQRALRANRPYIPLLMIVCALLIHMSTNSSSSLGGSFSGPSAWVLSFRQSLRISAVGTLLGLAVLARFIGPQSIVRTSTVPLAPNPMYVAFRDLWKDPLSMVQPGDTPGKLLTLDRFPRKSRRFQAPILASVLVHAAMAMMLGVALAFAVELPPTHRDHPDVGGSHAVQWWWTSVLIHTLSLLLPVLNLDHELDPRSVSLNGRNCLTSAGKNAFAVVLLTAIPSVVLARSTVFGMQWVVRVFFNSYGVSLYLEFLQQTVSLALFYPPSDCRLLVHELYDDGTEVPYVKVLLCSILRGDEAVHLMHQVTVEQEEYDRIRKCARSLASAELKMGVTAGVDRAEAMLEEDVLQMVLLEAIYSTRKAITALLETPHSLYLFRALCVLISTFAEILLRCTSLSSSTDLVVLPPGFLCAIEYAVVGISRCIQLRFPSGSGSDWSLSPVATVLPSVLESTFSLRLALLDFAQRRADGRPVGLHSPELMHLVRLCDTATRQWVDGKSLKLWNTATEEWVREIKTRPAHH